MKWYNPTTWFVDEVEEKENPAQNFIAWQEGSALSSTAAINYANIVCGAIIYTQYNFHTPFIGDYKHVD